MHSVALVPSFDTDFSNYDLWNQNFSFYADAEFLKNFQKFFETLGSNLVDVQIFSRIDQWTYIMLPTLKDENFSFGLNIHFCQTLTS